MAVNLSEEHARRLRIRAQRLGRSREAPATVAQVVRDACGLQAQDAGQAVLGVGARSRGLTATDVEAALVEERSVVRTWCMRGTRHFVAAEDLPCMLSLFGPLYVRRGRRRLAELGLDDEACERAVGIIREALADGRPLTREEVAERLLREGLTFDPGGQAPIHIIRRACLEGVACEAAPRDGKETYALLSDEARLEPPSHREDALAELARRYVVAYQPATLDDFARWSGLYKRDARTGWNRIAGELAEVNVAGGQAWILSADRDAVEQQEAPPLVRLLPWFDGYLLGHRTRDLVVPASYAREVHPGGGMIRATVLVDGRVVATWKLDRLRKTPSVVVQPFEALGSAVVAALEDEIEHLGRFLERDVTLQLPS